VVDAEFVLSERASLQRSRDAGKISGKGGSRRGGKEGPPSNWTGRSAVFLRDDLSLGLLRNVRKTLGEILADHGKVVVSIKEGFQGSPCIRDGGLRGGKGARREDCCRKKTWTLQGGGHFPLKSALHRI